MKTVDEIKQALRDVGLDDWEIQDRTDNYVKLVPRDWISITYKMLGLIELALETDRMNLCRVDSEPGYRISSVTYEEGEPGYVYIDVYDK